MVALFTEGFDKYGLTATSFTTSQTVVQTMLTANEWTSTGGEGNAATYNIAAGLSATGAALKLTYAGTSNTHLTKTLSTTYSRLIGGIRFSSDLGSNSGLSFGTAGSSRCSITINTDGTISLRTGTNAGTAIASGGSVSANTTHYLEWDITFGASSSYQVWLDGASLFSGSTGNTGNGSTSAQQLAFIGATVANITWDDLYLFDSTGSQNNAVLLTSPRIETQFPSTDSSVQFGFGAAILGTASQRVATTNAPGANELFLRSFTPTVACTINSVACIPGATSAGANFKAVIYSDSAGAPSTLLSAGSQVTGATSGTTLTAALTTPQSLSAGTPYWIGFITDTSVVLQEVDSTTTGSKAANTYGSGAPGSAPGMTTGQASWIIYGNLTGVSVNWYEVSVNPPPGDISYVFDSTVGHEDLFNFPALSVTPSAIYAVAVKGYIRKSDSGARTVDLRMKSGGTDSAGTNAGQAPATTYGWLDSFFETDPNTSAAWLPANLNAATSGYKVAS